MAHVSANPAWTNTNATPINSTALENIEGGVDNVHSKVFGSTAGTPNTEIPVCEYVLTTTYTGLTSADYLMTGNMSVVVDNYSMFNNANGYYRVILPFAGRWNCEWTWYCSVVTTGQFAAAKILLNPPSNAASTGTTVQNAVTSTSIFSAVLPAVTNSEGTPVNINQSRVFAAGDALAFALYSSATFSMPLNRFGGINTRFVIRYVGNK